MNTPLSRTAALAISLSLPLASLAAQVNWSSTSNSGAPTAFGGSAWDTARGRLVAFGGEVGTGPGAVVNNNTAEWNGTAWLTINPANRPSARRRPAMAYDAARGECVLFGGGFGAAGFLQDTWVWNGTNWFQRTPALTPPARFGAAMAYDSARQVVVMFGGFNPAGTDLNDTWEWNGTNWTPRTTSPTPSARGAHRLAFDAARGVTLLYGGFSTPTGLTLADTWRWNGTTWTTGPAGPGSLCDQVFVYDPDRQRVVLWGGLRFTGASVGIDLNQTWEWTGTSWTQRTTTSTPIARSVWAAGFDPASRGVLLSGGATGNGFQFGDTWTLRPTNPASVLSYGTGCPASGGPVSLSVVTPPYLGGNFTQEIQATSVAPLIGLLNFGLSDTLWGAFPLPFDLAVAGAPGCFVQASLDVIATVPMTNGTGSLTWSLPAQPSAVGFIVFTQAFVLDVASPLPLQIGASSGRRFTFGSP